MSLLVEKKINTKTFGDVTGKVDCLACFVRLGTVLHKDEEFDFTRMTMKKLLLHFA